MSRTRRTLTTVGLFGTIIAAITAAAPAATGSAGSIAAVRPVIGQPVAVPSQPLPGRRFTVSFKVRRSDTRGPLTSGKMTARSSLAGRVIPHTKSFARGTARVSFVVPTNAAGKALTVKVTIAVGGRSATRVAAFRVQQLPKPSLAIDDASAAEGNGAATTLAFRVSLSAASSRTVSVGYATADATAASPADYAAASGTVTFAPGETEKTIPVSVVADAVVEPDETFTLTLSNPVNAIIGTGTATGRIANDDVRPLVTPGSYRGATQDGNYVFLTVLPNQTITGFRVNDLSEPCNGPFILRGGVDWTENIFAIRSDGSFAAEGSWTGSVVQGDFELTNWSARLTGRFDGTSVTGTVRTTDEFNYQGTHYVCTTGEVRWSATLQG
jgi:Calx-beta domain